MDLVDFWHFSCFIWREQHLHASNDNERERIIMKKINKLLSGTALALALAAGFGSAHADVSTSGNFNAAGYAVLGFNTVGGVVDIQFGGGYSDATFSLFNAAGAHLVSNDDSNGSLNPRLTQFLSAGNYSPNEMTFLTAIRLGWTAEISGGFLPFLPLVLFGFHPVGVFVMLAANLIYQFWIHTETVPRLGWLELVLNTPSNHRVHHASNDRYLDRNFGGVLVIFDRLFGTYIAEAKDEPCRYGLTTPLLSTNPVTIAFHEWRNMLRDARRACGWKAKLRMLFGPPGAPLETR